MKLLSSRINYQSNDNFKQLDFDALSVDNQPFVSTGPGNLTIGGSAIVATGNVPDPTSVGQMVTSNAADDWQLNSIDAVVAAANQHDLSVISVTDEAGHFDISNFRYNPTAGTGATQPLNTFKTSAGATPSWVPVFNRTNNLPVTASYDSSNEHHGDSIQR